MNQQLKSLTFDFMWKTELVDLSIVTACLYDKKLLKKLDSLTATFL